MHDILKIDGRAVVRAKSNIWLAGQPAGVEIEDDSVGPEDDPREKPFEYILQQSTRYLLISASGITTISNGEEEANRFPPGFGIIRVRAENGIGELIAPIGMLIGVFLDDNRPTPGGEPGRIEIGYLPISIGLDDFSTPAIAGRHWGVLRRPFGIGAGPFFVIVPEGATRLFLGVMARKGNNHLFSGNYYTALVEASDAR